MTEPDGELDDDATDVDDATAAEDEAYIDEVHPIFRGVYDDE